tara:strand:+ start:235 stop:519 length:285 start_codon:yes stop_codon:yes gene_type:complete
MSKLIDFETKKSVHINLTKSTHSGLRIELFERGLSMQEVFNALASAICEGDPNLHRMLDDIEVKKKEKSIKQVTNSDAESIFNVIEDQSPLAKR